MITEGQDVAQDLMELALSEGDADLKKYFNPARSSTPASFNVDRMWAKYRLIDLWTPEAIRKMAALGEVTVNELASVTGIRHQRMKELLKRSGKMTNPEAYVLSLLAKDWLKSVEELANLLQVSPKHFEGLL